MNQITKQYISTRKKQIEDVVVATMTKYYDSDSAGIPNDFRPNLKYIEKVVSYYDYFACGISVLAPLAVSGNLQAKRLVDNLLRNMDHYRTKIYNHNVKDYPVKWTVPLRRLLFHAALAYEILLPILSKKQKSNFKKLLVQQTKLALSHNNDFYPSEKNLHLGFANNHTAIFMQGVFHVGRILGIKSWMQTAKDGAMRLFHSGHPDGYWEENTNISREGGPSMVYTPLTAGCLYDILEGYTKKQKRFKVAGNFYRSFLDNTGCSIPLADERTNCHEKISIYGLALHSLSAKGRGYIKEMLSSVDWKALSPEGLAVLYYELGLMQTGVSAKPEYKCDKSSRITLPLGVIRQSGWVAGISALRALNRVRQPNSDYALDHQNLAFLANKKNGVILSGFKSKNDLEYSTFRRGVDGYPIDTGILRMGKNWAEVNVRYATFNAILRWELGKHARLIFETSDSRAITTTLPITNVKYIFSDSKFKKVKLKGFSPYTSGNKEDAVNAVRFRWKNRLVVNFKV